MTCGGQHEGFVNLARRRCSTGGQSTSRLDGAHCSGVPVPRIQRRVRFAILQHLSLGEHRVVNLTAQLGLA
jgi:hypothetical protein